MRLIFEEVVKMYSFHYDERSDKVKDSKPSLVVLAENERRVALDMEMRERERDVVGGWGWFESKSINRK